MLYIHDRDGNEREKEGEEKRLINHIAVRSTCEFKKGATALESRSRFFSFLLDRAQARWNDLITFFPSYIQLQHDRGQLSTKISRLFFSPRKPPTSRAIKPASSPRLLRRIPVLQPQPAPQLESHPPAVRSTCPTRFQLRRRNGTPLITPTARGRARPRARNDRNNACRADAR